MEVTFEAADVIIEDGPFPYEREDRPRSRTWPILPPPIETIHENADAEIASAQPVIIEEVEEPQNEQQKAETNPRKNSRKNAWGNLSYADLITRAIQSSPEQRLTLSQIYEWMVRNIPYFKDKGDSTSSAGWKNSIRHNLSLHSRFMRVQNDNNGKSSYWVINPDAKPGKSSRRSRSGSVDGQPKDSKRSRRTKKLHQSTDDITALSPNAMKFKQNLSCDNLFNIASPCSSTDSLSNIEDYHDISYSAYLGDNFARPRSTSNVSQQSSVAGCATPVHIDIDEDLKQLEDNMKYNSNGPADETANMVETMSIDNVHRNMVSLDDSMKIVKQEQKFNMQNDCMQNFRRAKSDSFGSGDSGYESPACFSPQQQQQQQQRPINKMPSPKLVPNKPPPPYNQMNQFCPNPAMTNQQQANMHGYFQQPQQQSVNHRLNPAQRLKHPPLPSQNNFSPYPPQQQIMQNYQSYGSNPPIHAYNPYAQKNLIAPNMNVKISSMNMYQVNPIVMQSQPSRAQTDMFNNEIPSDLTQLKLDFDDPQQLANDLDAIIKNDLLTLNNSNTMSNTSVSHANCFNKYQLTGQNWVS